MGPVSIGVELQSNTDGDTPSSVFILHETVNLRAIIFKKK